MFSPSTTTCCHCLYKHYALTTTLTAPHKDGKSQTLRSPLAMARCNLGSLLLSVAVVLAAGLAARPVSAAHLHFYMHDVLTGPSPTAVQVLNGPRGHFGDTIVIDDMLTEGASRSSAAVGRAQGHYIWASTGNPELLVTVNMVLTSGPYAGSSITVVGRDDIGAPMRELSVVGGTGQFRMARGYVLWKTVSLDHPNAVLELDVYVN